MSSTLRRRHVLALILSTVLLLATASPAFAASPISGPQSLLAQLLDWLSIGDHRATANGTTAPNLDPDGTEAAPNLDPNGVLGVPPILLLDPDGDGATSQDDGEAAPNLDPDG